jgi:hypothetical protein
MSRTTRICSNWVPLVGFAGRPNKRFVLDASRRNGVDRIKKPLLPLTFRVKKKALTSYNRNSNPAEWKSEFEPKVKCQVTQVPHTHLQLFNDKVFLATA